MGIIARRSGRTDGQQGFTLLELTVVLFIVVLGLAAVSIRISSGDHAAQLKSTVNDLMSALKYARSQAVISQIETVVEIDLAQNSYSLDDKTYSIPDFIDLTLVIAQEEFKQNAIARVRFFPDGSSTGGQLNLETETMEQTIEVNWLTGRVGLKRAD